MANKKRKSPGSSSRSRKPKSPGPPLRSKKQRSPGSPPRSKQPKKPGPPSRPRKSRTLSRKRPSRISSPRPRQTPVRLTSIPEPRRATAGAFGSLPGHIWDAGGLKKALRGRMDRDEWATLCKAHQTIVSGRPLPCDCLRRWSTGQIGWDELLAHLEERLNEHLRAKGMA